MGQRRLSLRDRLAVTLLKRLLPPKKPGDPQRGTMSVTVRPDGRVSIWIVCGDRLLVPLAQVESFEEARNLALVDGQLAVGLLDLEDDWWAMMQGDRPEDWR